MGENNLKMGHCTRGKLKSCEKHGFYLMIPNISLSEIDPEHLLKHLAEFLIEHFIYVCIIDSFAFAHDTWGHKSLIIHFSVVDFFAEIR